VRCGGCPRAPVRTSEDRGVDGPADRACEPSCARRSRGSCDRPSATRLSVVHGAFHRRRPFQGHQRLARPRCRRLRAAGGRRGLRDRLRRGDILARYGGEEFVALLPDTDLPAALRVAEILRKRVASLDFGSLTGGLPVRVSIGVAQLSEELMAQGHLSPPPTRRCTRQSARAAIGSSSGPEPARRGCATTEG